ncbi:hypothetical protein BBAD15_g12499 [Beauveria bassiana D1-5]|uniref:Uncharacterized protein n=1 Tax=Beauveria bassiana D1-5 TaxID=1245745 RepID=A0A0A2V493_BEABA|nr:hypothetical protein BBAD15_g12499 [Beauveria bassiana D1-5]
MHADLVEVVEAVEQAHIPVRGAARADMAQDLAVLAGQVLGAQRGDRAGAHVGNGGRVHHRQRLAVDRIEQV